MENFGIQEILRYLFIFFFFTKKILKADKVIVQDFLEQNDVGRITLETKF